MLVELYCEKFRQNTITFHEGLNVVLGDDNAANSIGKSSFLMVVDFVFGGESILEHNKDIVEELGDHDYFFTFSFSGREASFRRNTHTPDLLYKCDRNYKDIDPITLDEYKAFLKSSYALADIDLTFRSIVSLYSRVWGKDNDDVKQPLHNHKKQTSVGCIDTLIKLFNKYGSIKLLSHQVNALENEKGAINKAYKQDLIPKITKRKYKSNLQEVAGIQQEIEDIKTNLASYAVSLNEIINREVSEVKKEKDILEKEKSKITIRLERVKSDLDNNKHIKSKSFKQLLEYFPGVDADRVSKVEEFHSKISKILKSELLESKAGLEKSLESINTAILGIDSKLSETFSRVEDSGVIIDRVYDLTTKHNSASAEIKYFEQEEGVKGNLKEIKENLMVERGKIIKLVQDIINDKTRKYVSQVYSEERRSPELALSNKSYAFTAEEDTGTGKAYSNLVIFDLAIMNATVLPFVIHDTFLFKNIENDAVANLVDLYVESNKQSFIAIDEITKYGKYASGCLVKNMVVKLTNTETLYIKDWRK